MATQGYVHLSAVSYTVCLVLVSISFSVNRMSLWQRWRCSAQYSSRGISTHPRALPGALQGVDRGSVRCASCSDSATSPPRLNPGPSSSFHTCGSPINCTADYSILCLPPGEPTQTPPPFFITSFHLLELKNHQMETFI